MLLAIVAISYEIMAIIALPIQAIDTKEVTQAHMMCYFTLQCVAVPTLQEFSAPLVYGLMRSNIT